MKSPTAAATVRRWHFWKDSERNQSGFSHYGQAARQLSVSLPVRHVLRYCHQEKKTMEGRGTIIFGENSSATVNYRFDESGRGNVEYATGSPKWNPVVLLHRKAFRLVLADGREAKVFVLTEDGLAQMAEERTLAHFCDNLNCRCDVVDPNGELPLNPPCPKCGKQMFTTRIVDLDVNQEN